jgi:ATP-dependent Clp protease adaptor protein ClpS
LYKEDTLAEPSHKSFEDASVSEKEKVQYPAKFKVVLHNDDYTTMDFVIMILVNVFNKSEMKARTLMLSIHRQGKAVCGVYTREIAETKAVKVHTLARKNNFPLKATIEEE